MNKLTNEQLIFNVDSLTKLSKNLLAYDRAKNILSNAVDTNDSLYRVIEDMVDTWSDDFAYEYIDVEEAKRYCEMIGEDQDITLYQILSIIKDMIDDLNNGNPLHDNLGGLNYLVYKFITK